MRWYEGDIAQAVATSKQQNAVFVVYVQGHDAKSVNLTSIINNDEIASQLESATFVAIKVEAGTVSHNQFAAIFKAVPVPSLFFIGKNGTPIDIVTDATVTDLSIRINNVIDIHSGRPAEANTTAQTSEAFLKCEQQQQGPVAVADEAFVESASTSAAPVALLNDSSATTFLDAEKKQEVSKEEKIQRAKELLEQKRLAKKQEEDELARTKEIERRKMGQDVQKMRRSQQDADMKALMEERQRIKAEEKAARDRILAQIAMDKADRAAKFGTAAASVAAEPVPAASRPQQATSNTAHLQFRMPDGSHRTHEFDSTTTLLQVREFVMQNLTLPFRNFTLSTTFPRREFTVHQNNDTLRDLGLCPNAVILVLQGHSSGVVTSNSSGGIYSLFWLLVSPIVGFFGYFRHLIFGQNGAPPLNGTPRNTTSPPPETNQSATDLNATKQQTQPTKRKTAETSTVRRQGSTNIHRLSDRTDSDEDNNTWNGNSTQQM